jgi:hypothetical protein
VTDGSDQRDPSPAGVAKNKKARRETVEAKMQAKKPYTPSSTVTALEKIKSSFSFIPWTPPDNLAVLEPTVGASIILIGALLILIVWMTNVCFCCECGRKKCEVCTYCFCGPTCGAAILNFLLILSAIVLVCGYRGRGLFHDATKLTSGSLTTLGDSFDSLVDGADEMRKHAAWYKTQMGELGYNPTAASSPNLGGNLKCTTNFAHAGSSTAPGEPVFGFHPAANDCDFTSLAGGDFSTCPLAYPAVQLDIMAKFANATIDLAANLGPLLHKGATMIDETVPKKIDQGLGAMVGVIWLLVILSLCAVATKNCKGDDYMVLLIGSAILVLVLVAIGIEITVANVVSSICDEGPDVAIPRLMDEYAKDISPTGKAQIDYIITCNGTSSLEPLFVNVWETIMVYDWATDKSAYSNTNDLSADVYVRNHGDAIALHGCDATTSDAINARTADVAKSLYMMWENYSCPKANAAWVALMYDVVCTDLLTAIFELAMVQFASWCLLVITFLFLPCATRKGKGEK